MPLKRKKKICVDNKHIDLSSGMYVRYILTRDKIWVSKRDQREIPLLIVELIALPHGKAPLAQLITSVWRSQTSVSLPDLTRVYLCPPRAFKVVDLNDACYCGFVEFFFGKTSFISTRSVLIFFARRNLSAFWVTDSQLIRKGLGPYIEQSLYKSI